MSIGLRMQPRNEKFFPFAGKGPNAVERAAILPEAVAPRELGQARQTDA